ncbi:hypothetical protein B0H13DRAFT_928553 [Mycena leptocephala]|nr:hypothetical protein B0H13DRAFT_928553 [Mycena leptocephala]
MGFLYYHKGPQAAPLEGSIRFRITPNRAPSSFALGQDLLWQSGLPWHITLPQVALQNAFIQFRDQLLSECLVTEEELSQCRHIFQGRRINGHTIFRLTQEFPVHFESGGVQLFAVADTLLHVGFPYLFRGCIGSIQHDIWNGFGIVRFEASTRPENAGRRVIHLRIVKIVTPVSCTVDTLEEYNCLPLKPEEGQLLTVQHAGKVPEPWAYDIDGKTKACAVLRALWDVSGM